MGIGPTVINPSYMGALEQALRTHPVSLFFSESPTNPFLRCVDVSTISRLCHAAGALMVVDSTFATPINQRALSLGADLVIHSGTKYLSGHNDVLAGAALQRFSAVRRSTRACGLCCWPVRAADHQTYTHSRAASAWLLLPTGGVAA